MKSISIIIPSWNGRGLLAEFLPAVTKEYAAYAGQKELLVIDDGSTDGTDDFLKENFPQIRLIKLNENRGFSFACNAGFKESKNEIVILLNNDVLIGENFIEALVKHFYAQDIFAVRAGIAILKEEKEKPDLSDFFLGLEFKRGMMEIPMLKLPAPRPFAISCAGGTAAAYDRAKLMELGGFDELYSPFYWEDVDLSYRALKRGWKILFEAEAECYHRTHSTIERHFSRLYREAISERNRYIIFWKNISDARMWLVHVLWILPRFLAFIITLRWHKAVSLILALGKIKRVICGRKLSVESVRDREIFKRFGKMQEGAEPFFRR